VHKENQLTGDGERGRGEWVDGIATEPEDGQHIKGESQTDGDDDDDDDDIFIGRRKKKWNPFFSLNPAPCSH
jgi:hypothetical protein